MAEPLRDRFLDIVIGQMRDCRYPSPTILDRIEGAVGDRQAAEKYVSDLLDRIGAERFPSPQMLDRISGLLDALDSAGGRPA